MKNSQMSGSSYIELPNLLKIKRQLSMLRIMMNISLFGQFQHHYTHRLIEKTHAELQNI